MRKDLAFSLRTLRRSPIFTVVAVLSLALGIGANTAIFSLLDQVVLRSLSVSDPERLVLLHTGFSRSGSSTSDNFESVFSYPEYRALRDRDPAFSGLIARSSAGVTLAYQGNAEPVSAEVVSGNFFQTLGIGAAAGRTLNPDDDGAPGAHPVIVLSHSYWSSRFDRKLSILNQTVTVNGHPMVVIGVADPKFNGLMSGESPELFVPIAMQKVVRPTWDVLETWNFRWLSMLARLKPGVTLPKAQAATDVAYHSVNESEMAQMGWQNQHDRTEFLNHKLEVRPASQGINELRRKWEKPLVALMAMVGLVLLIACANVAGLMVARAAGRQREIAIRLALGAGRAALIRQLLAEGLLLFVTGGLFGLALGVWLIKALMHVLPRDYAGNWVTAQLDLRILGFNLAVSVASGLLFALIPALQSSRADVAGVLKDQASNVAGGAARFRQALVTAEVALSLLLMVGAGLFAASLANVMRVNLGFHTTRLLIFNVNATLSRPQLQPAVAFYHDLEQRLRSLGGVTGVTAADCGPFSNSGRGSNLTIEGYTPKGDESVGGSMAGTGPGYFHALGIPLRAGREFSERDFLSPEKVVVVNEAFAKKYFRGSSPLGRHLMIGGGNHPVLDREIVGVVADIHLTAHDEQKETLYHPYSQWPGKADRLTYYVRASGSDSAVAADIRQVLRSMDASVPVGEIRPIQARIDESIYADRLIAILAIAFGVLATILAALGLYGVVSYAVARRTPEIGIRMALGALPSAMLRMVLWDAGRMAAAGIVIGLAGAWALSRYVESQLFGVKPADPAIFCGAAVVLAVVAAAAAFVPGWKASRINPVRALKYE
jgi:predicted permease